MPTGVPKIGSYKSDPQPEVLGTIKPELTAPGPQAPKADTWMTEEGFHGSIQDPPPPWELPGGEFADSDARRFVTVPDNWELRWINPRVLDSEGWRDWQPVMANDPRVKVKVSTMISPSHNIRRGGEGGDILGWMYKSWVESRRKQQQEKTRQLAQSAVDRQEQLKEDFKRGKYGPYVRLEEARHPTHTIGDGRSMKD